MTEATLTEIEFEEEEDPDDGHLVLRTTIQVDADELPPRTDGSSSQTVVRARIHRIVDDLFPNRRVRDVDDR